jgi:hypothetical protein
MIFPVLACVALHGTAKANIDFIRDLAFTPTCNTGSRTRSQSHGPLSKQSLPSSDDRSFGTRVSVKIKQTFPSFHPRSPQHTHLAHIMEPKTSGCLISICQSPPSEALWQQKLHSPTIKGLWQGTTRKFRDSAQTGGIHED